MKTRICRALAPALVVLASTSCQRGGGLRQDPFLPGPVGAARPAGNIPAGPAAPRPGDTARGVSTSPATDPLYGELSAAPSEWSERSNVPGPGNESLPLVDAAPYRGTSERDPFLNSDPAAGGDERQPANRFAGIGGGDEPAADGGGVDYRGIRRRLDRLGVRNFRLETDVETGETLFRCALPYPDDPDHLRVFEARDPDELKSMLAVTEAIEAWIASGQPRQQAAPGP